MEVAGVVVISVITGLCAFFSCRPFVQWIVAAYRIRSLVPERNVLLDWAQHQERIPRVLQSALTVNGNNLNVYKEMTIDSINAARKKLVIISCSALSTHWDQLVAQQLKAAHQRGVEIVFLVAKDQFDAAASRGQNRPICDLAREEAIRLRYLEAPPPGDYRLIDDDAVFFTVHSSEDSTKRPFIFVRDLHPAISGLIQRLKGDVYGLLRQSVIAPVETLPTSQA